MDKEQLNEIYADIVMQFRKISIDSSRSDSQHFFNALLKVIRNLLRNTDNMTLFPKGESGDVG